MSDTHTLNGCPLMRVNTCEELSQANDSICCSVGYLDMDHSTHSNCYITCPKPEVLGDYCDSLNQFMKSCDTDKSYQVIGYVYGGECVMFDNAPREGTELQYVVGSVNCEGFTDVPHPLTSSCQIFDFDYQMGCVLLMENPCSKPSIVYNDPFTSTTTDCCTQVHTEFECDDDVPSFLNPPDDEDDHDDHDDHEDEVMDCLQKQEEVQNVHQLLVNCDLENISFDEIIDLITMVINCMGEDHPQYDTLMALTRVTETEFLKLQADNTELMGTIAMCCDLCKDQSKGYDEQIATLRLQITQKCETIVTITETLRTTTIDMEMYRTDLEKQNLAISTCKQEVLDKIAEIEALKVKLSSLNHSDCDYDALQEKVDQMENEMDCLNDRLQNCLNNSHLSENDLIDKCKVIAQLHEDLENETKRATEAQEFRQVQTQRANVAQDKVACLSNKLQHVKSTSASLNTTLVQKNTVLTLKVAKLSEELVTTKKKLDDCNKTDFIKTENGQIIVAIIVLIVLTIILITLVNTAGGKFVVFFIMLAVSGSVIYNIKDRFEKERREVSSPSCRS